ncbi:MAG: DUF5615 family PIN-like protein [Sulfurovum sp.]|nr:DUF5615 family PIN-like protein [Sulfurovum sp.]
MFFWFKIIAVISSPLFIFGFAFWLRYWQIFPNMKGSETWKYARDNNLTIVTKDADFSDLVLLNNPPPSVIHVKLGNMKMKVLVKSLSVWQC